MAYAFWKSGWQGRRKMLVVRYRGASGSWVEERRPNDRTKADALEYARQQERAADQVRKGNVVEVAPVTFGALWDRWWKGDGSRRRSVSKFDFKSSLEKHLGGLRDFVLKPGTAGVFADKLDELLAARETAGDLGPQTLNHLRAGVHRMFEYGRDPKVGLWRSENPVRWVKRRKVPRTRKPTLAHDEVRPVLAAFPAPVLGAPWRWAAAVCVYSGARPGEAFGLHKSDVDLDAGVMTIRYSWTSPMPKDEEPRQVVIVPELRAHLEAAIAASPSELVFPRADGRPFDESIRFNLVDVLRRALVGAGVLVGYAHVCRRCKGQVKRAELPKETSHTWQHADAVQRACENVVAGEACGMKLWAKALPRPLRFYDLRHSYATLLRRGGVDLGTVQKALGHSDPRITAATYDHTELEDRRPQLARVLTFAVPTSNKADVAPAVAPAESENTKPAAPSISLGQPRASMVGATGFEPATTCTPSPLLPATPSSTQRTDAHPFDVSETSLRLSAALNAPSAPIVTENGGTRGGTRLPSAVPSFLEACANLAQRAAERGDFVKAVELMQKAAKVAALREEAA